ncbi:MAG TPA: FAD-dependent oxidoreductase [Caulobacteraceae bacterium]|jgi:pyruvate/2-oxoglutarate dehydrogenase complex dihydrolipoamide dehydrogenase (E3) component
MPDAEHFEILILGSGQGGKLLAWTSAQAGRRTAMVERRWIGGSCPNIACLPSKNEIFSAKVAHLARRGDEFGVNAGPLSIDMAKVRQRKRDMVDGQVAAHLENYRGSGTELIMGEGRFVAPKTLEVRLNDGGTRLLTGDQVFLDVGTHAVIPDVPGLAAAAPLTHIEALELDVVPAHLIVLGGGYVGLELAQAYRRFGAEVTVVEQGARLVTREDPDVGAEMQRILGEEGVRFCLGAQPRSVRGRSGEAVSMVIRTGSGEETIEGSHLLVAAGRAPNTAGIGLAEAGVELDDRGFVRVNGRLETTAPGVWALGECAGSPQFTHVSVDDFTIVRDNLAGGNRSTRDRLIPYCMFTDPELVRVGLNESDARRLGIPVRVAKLPVRNVLRTQATGENKGFMKALVGADDERVLGFTMIGAEADGLLAAMQLAILAGLPFPEIRDAIFAHPTMAEGLGLLFSNVPPEAARTEGATSQSTSETVRESI